MDSDSRRQERSAGSELGLQRITKVRFLIISTPITALEVGTFAQTGVPLRGIKVKFIL